MKKSVQVMIREDEFYTIAAHNRRVLEVADYSMADGAPVRLWDYAGQPWQQWSFVSVGDGEYRIKNRFTGKMIDLAFGTTTKGTLLHQWAQTSGRSQRWTLQPAAGGTRICSVAAPTMCIDLVQMSTSCGTGAQIWQEVDGGNQEWVITRVADKTLPAPPAAKGKKADGMTPAQRKHAGDMVKAISGKNARGKKGK